MAFTLVTVTCTYQYQDETPASGTVSFTLSVPVANSGLLLSGREQTVTLDASGKISLVLPANDDPGTIPAGSSYLVKERIAGSPVRVYSIVIPHTAASLDLSTVAPAFTTPAYQYAPAGGPFAPTVTGASATTRYVGGTVSGAPTTGTFQLGDFVVTQAGGILVCTTAGTPGTWTAVAASTGAPPPAVTPSVGWWLGPYLANANVAESCANGTLYFCPYLIAQQITVDQLGVSVTTAGSAGAVVRLGVYSANANGQPSGLLVDAGTVDATTSGFKLLLLAAPLILQPGLYWGALAGQGGPATVPQCTFVSRSPLSNVSANSFNDLSSPPQAFYATAITGPLPASVTSSLRTTFSGEQGALIGLHRSA